MRLFAVGLAAVVACAGGARAEVAVKDPITKEAIDRLRAELPNPGVLLAAPDVAAMTVKFRGEVQPDSWSRGPEGVSERALRVSVPKREIDRWTCIINSPDSQEPINEGDVVLAAFWVRAVESSDESQEGRFYCRLQGNREPWPGVFDIQMNAGKEWRQLFVFGRSKRDFPAGEANLVFHLSLAKQVLEFGPVAILNMGPEVDLAKLPTTPVTYPGRSPDANWRRRAERGIERNRKGDLEVRVVDEKGKPVSGATLKVKMVRHAFNFGTFVGYRITEDTELGERYREFFLNNFNAATAPIYWADWGWANPARQRLYLEQIKWLNGQAVPTRGHCAIWPSWSRSPKRIRNYESQPELLRGIVRSHFDDVMSATAEFGLAWYDLVNEPRECRDLMEILGWREMAEWYRMSQELVPHSRLFLNEYGIVVGGAANRENVDNYHGHIRKLRKAKAPLGGIGIQCHFGSELTDPGKVLDVLDEFARYKLPIHVTEFDVDINDTEGQADYTRDFLTAFFSHPAAEAFIMWGFWEGDHWRPNGAMLRDDWSPKPNYEVYRKLVYGDWWTDELVSTDREGKVRLRGFQGDYEVTAEAGEQSRTQRVRLGPGGARIILTL